MLVVLKTQYPVQEASTTTKAMALWGGGGGKV